VPGSGLSDQIDRSSQRTPRWRKADSNRWSHLRLNGSDADERDKQIAMSRLRRIDKQFARTVGNCAYRPPRVRLQALCTGRSNRCSEKRLRRTR
jgi:hypothetical protein